ncbi:MAG: DNA translocase FtsK [Clostridia bacterium]|nr:DNA translocase FtsK [Clostridia bacterium]
MRVKKIQKKKLVEKEKGISKLNHEIIALVVVVFGILLCLSFYLESSIGVFGSFMKELLLGIIGPPGYVIPPIVFIYGIFMLFKRNGEKFNKKVLYTFILILFISALIQTGGYDAKEYENRSFFNSVGKFYTDGQGLDGGGILGGIISLPFLALFQVLGTIIILTTLALIVVIMITDISIAEILRKVKAFLAGLASGLFKKKESIDEEPQVVGFGDGNALSGGSDSKAKPKVIDFNAEKNTRDIKGKNEKSPYEVEHKAEEEPVQLIVNDIKKTKENDLKQIKESVNMEIALQERQDIAYHFPPFDLLNNNSEDGKNLKNAKNSAIEVAKKLEETLLSFGVDAKVINISRGPAVTRYELQPSPGVKVSKIVNLADDISLNLAASGVRIEAPIPGKAAIGIEVPNKEVIPVFLRDVLETADFVQFPSNLAFAVGKDISGNNVIADIGRMPHMLVAGATGSGKSVCINSLIISLLFKSSPNDVKLLMVDPKVVELGIYNGIPHLLIPVVTDPRKAAGALNWAVQEMVNRYKLFADKGVRDLGGYNAMVKEQGGTETLPQIVIIIDELADLMMVAPNDVEDAICRLAQMARAAGMYLVIATQRPSVDVITGVIKANIPSRISFAVSSQVDSRTILDMAGAEKLMGKGDMLFYPIGQPKPVRVKGAFVSDKEVEKVVEYIKSQGSAEYNHDIIEEINSEEEPAEPSSEDRDELLPQAIDLVVETGQASVSLIQRRFKVGYARAARIIDQMEARGIVGGFEGSKPRQILISKQEWQELKMADSQ